MSKKKSSFHLYDGINEIMSGRKQRQVLSMFDDATKNVAEWCRNIQYGWSISLPSYDSLFENDFLIATFEIGEEVIAFVQFSIYTSQNYKRPSLDIRQIFVKKEFRNKNYGSKLIRNLFDLYKNHTFHISVWEQNEIGRKFWNSLGFCVPLYTTYFFDNNESES